MTNAKKFLIFSFIIYGLTLIYSCSLQNFNTGKHVCVYGHCVKLEKFENLTPKIKLDDLKVKCKEQQAKAHIETQLGGGYSRCTYNPGHPSCPCSQLKERQNE